jgi:tRNA (guanine37-N1)-methyltransferase
MKFTFVTLFESLIKDYFHDSILSRAIKAELLEVAYLSSRDFTEDKHHKVDDYQAGGGAGLLMKPEPLSRALDSLKREDKESYFIFVAPAGKPFKQIDAKRLVEKKHIVLVSGRYEGIDERIIESYADEIFSIGDFILTGGELPSLCICDAISRNIPGVLGNEASLEVESFEDALLEAPAFTKPNIFNKSAIIKEYLKGNHSKISALKKDLSVLKTKYFRPDLYKKVKTNNKFQGKKR